MDSVQESSGLFFLPLAVAYLSACGGWFLLNRFRPSLWVSPRLGKQSRDYKDLGLALLAVIGILLLGQVYRMGFLLPTKGESWIFRITWIIDNLIIYSPIFVVMWLRKQPLVSIFLSPQGLEKKLGIGLVLGIIAVVLFLLLRDETGRLPEIATKAIEPRRLADFVPVFLEGVAVAFLFVRLRWAFGLLSALLIPALLFALAHVPGQMAAGTSFPEMASFFVVNTGLVAVVLYIVQRSEDVIWIGIVHYLMDIATNAI
jgi:hypothetical protein